MCPTSWAVAMWKSTERKWYCFGAFRPWRSPSPAAASLSCLGTARSAISELVSSRSPSAILHGGPPLFPCPLKLPPGRTFSTPPVPKLRSRSPSRRQHAPAGATHCCDLLLLRRLRFLICLAVGGATSAAATHAKSYSVPLCKRKSLPVRSDANANHSPPRSSPRHSSSANS